MRATPGGAAIPGCVTSRSYISAAASMVAICRSSFDLKCAKRPLLLMPTCSASRAIDRPSSPSTVASSVAALRIAWRLRAPSARWRRPSGFMALAGAGVGMLDKLARTVVFVFSTTGRFTFEPRPCFLELTPMTRTRFASTAAALLAAIAFVRPAAADPPRPDPPRTSRSRTGTPSPPRPTRRRKAPSRCRSPAPSRSCTPPSTTR